MAKFKKLTAFLMATMMLASFAFTACEGDETVESSSPSESSSSPLPTPEPEPEPTPHEHKYNQLKKTITAPTCTTKGLGEFACSCGEGGTQELEIPIKASAHKYTWTTTAEPTCGAAGSETGVCAYNSAHTTTRSIPALDHEWIWTLDEPVTCTEDGSKSAVCKHDSTHTQTNVTIEKRGHEYDDGKCIRCEATPTLPEIPQDVQYVDPYDEDSNIEGSGVVSSEKWDMYELSLGYYEFTIESESTGKGGGVWLSVILPEAGQYAIYSKYIYSEDGNTDNVTVTQYDASAAYIPLDGNGDFYGDEGTTLDDGNFYSDYNCGTKYWSVAARATWRISGDIGDIVKVAIVRIDEPAWIPETIRSSVKPEQLNGVTAENGAENEELKVVPYTAEYFYDETTGYYRLGTKDNPKQIIYVAITKVAERMLSEKAFSQIHNEGSNLILYYKEDVDGNYLTRDYSPFIDKDSSEDDNCYENYVNADGVYPVNQELFEFLHLYVNSNKPMDIPDSVWEDKSVRAEKAWLAACYYYTAAAVGTEENPDTITQTGEVEITTTLYLEYYCTFNYKPTEDEEIEANYCTLTWDSTTNAVIIIGDKTYSTKDGDTSVKFENGSTIIIKYGGENDFATTQRHTLAFTLTVSAE